MSNFVWKMLQIVLPQMAQGPWMFKYSLVQIIRNDALFNNVGGLSKEKFERNLNTRVYWSPPVQNRLTVCPT